VFRLACLLQGLKLQAVGIRMSASLPQATTIARKQYGLKGNLASLTEQVAKLLAKVKSETTYVEELPEGTPDIPTVEMV
jgi:GTP1/Obg family GTP-binding protein